MAEKQNTPVIRFEGFTDPWEQRKLGELLLFQNGFNGSSESFGSGIPLISVMDVLDDEFITHETIRGKARLNYEEASRYCVEYGDVLFQRSSENQEDAGTSNVYLDQHVPSAFGGFVIRGKKVDEYNPIFIKYLLGSSFIRKQITHRAQGAQHINVSQDTLADVVLLMPSMREQEAVGLVFLHLANLITLHQRKHEKLCTVKKSMLDKMFPKPGETEPEIRFEGFTDPWEQRKLGEVGEIYTGNTPATDNPIYYSNDGIPWITPSDIVDFNTPKPAKYLSEVGLKVGRTVPAGSIMCTCIASIGKNTITSTTCGFNQQINALVPNKEQYDSNFLFAESYLWSQTMKRDAAEGTMQIVNKSEFSELNILKPSLIEQQAIGSFFSRLDHLITLHQRKLDLLKNMKKSLLDKMFV